MSGFTPVHQQLRNGPGLKNSAMLVAVLAALNIVFSVALAAVVKQKLDYQTDFPYCYLNTKGQVCVFTYVTAGAVAVIMLGAAAPILWLARRTGTAPKLVGEQFSLALFSFIWQLVMSITITIRGGEASDAGIPGDSDRSAAIVLAWMAVACTIGMCGLIAADLYIQLKGRKPEGHRDDGAGGTLGRLSLEVKVGKDSPNLAPTSQV